MVILSKKGLTLIELMVALAIMGIMTAIVYQDYRNFLLQQRLNGAAFMVSLDLMLARAQAISMNRAVSVTFATSPSSQYTYDATGTPVTKNFQTGLIGYYGVTLCADRNPIFSSRGTVKNTAGTNPVTTIILRNSAGSKTLTVNIAGRITIR